VCGTTNGEELVVRDHEIKIFLCEHKPASYETGGVYQTYTILDHLAEKYCSVEYLCTEKVPSRLIKKNPFLRNFWYCLFRIRTVSGDKTVVIFDYTSRYHLVLFAMAVRLLLKTKVVILIQATYFALRESSARNSIDRFISRLFLRTAHLVVTSGKALNVQVDELGFPTKNVRTQYPALRKEFLRYNLPNKRTGANQTLRLLFVGRISPIKGVDYLLKAISMLKGRPIELIMVGPNQAAPSFLRSVEELIATCQLNEYVVTKGRVQDVNELIGIYETSQVFVCPSVWDTSPIAIMEAMSFGLPIVATDVGGIPEWVSDGVNGILVPSRDPASLARAIQLLIDDPPLRKSMGNESFQKYLQYPYKDWSIVADSFYEYISDLFIGSGSAIK
jgi:glycosyltransferase involved in cell wall biosynthesis